MAALVDYRKAGQISALQAKPFPQRKEYAAIARERDMLLEQPNLSRANGHLGAMGVRPLSRNLFESAVELADNYMQLSVPSFKFSRVLPPSVRFIGALPMVPDDAKPMTCYSLNRCSLALSSHLALRQKRASDGNINQMIPAISITFLNSHMASHFSS
jgi:hypothetical protein